MLSINQLMKYLRAHHHIAVKSNQAQDIIMALRDIVLSELRTNA